MTDLMTYLAEHADRHLEDLKELLRIPSVSTDPAHAGDVRRAAEWLTRHFEGLGLTAELHETGGHPIVYAEWLGAGEDVPTVLVYGHYDVQPPDPLEEWVTGPFDPTVRDGQIVARGATDDKGQMFAHVKAVEAHMAVSGRLPINIRFVIEGEEEVGSTHLATYVAANKERLRCDAVVISDSPMFAAGVPSITYGLRGLTYFEVEVQGPAIDLHSGLYGGSVANPINVLAGMIARLQDEGGRITVPGFYDDVRELTTQEREEWASLPFDEEGYRTGIGANALVGEEGYTTLERIWGRPTLDCNGIVGGFTGEGAKTVLPAWAKVKFSSRLVPDQDPADIEAKIEAWVKELAPASVRVKVTRMHGGRPVLVDPNTAAVTAAREALGEVYDARAVNIRGGGSIPIVADFSELLEVPVVLMGLGLPDDRLHSPNEKFELECYYKGIAAAALFYRNMASVRG